MKRLKIAVLFGGCSPEYSVSLQSAAAVLQNMDSSKYEAVMVGIPCALSCNADGIPRNGSQTRYALLHGQKVPIVGRICMDQKIVDITDLPDVKSGDIAVFIGKSGQYEITAYDLAEASGTITNELLSRLGSRLNRMIV